MKKSDKKIVGGLLAAAGITVIALSGKSKLFKWEMPAWMKSIIDIGKSNEQIAKEAAIEQGMNIMQNAQDIATGYHDATTDAENKAARDAITADLWATYKNLVSIFEADMVLINKELYDLTHAKQLEMQNTYLQIEREQTLIKQIAYTLPVDTRAIMLANERIATLKDKINALQQNIDADTATKSQEMAESRQKFNSDAAPVIASLQSYGITVPAYIYVQRSY